MIRHLDTNIIIAHLRGDAKATECLKQHKSEMAMSVFVYCELVFGARNASRPDLDIPDVENVARFVPVVTFGRSAPKCIAAFVWTFGAAGSTSATRICSSLRWPCHTALSS